MPRTRKKVITFLDDDRSETYATLDEALRAAQTWYIGVAAGKLPIWSYRVESLPEFRRAIGQYKAQIAQALGAAQTALNCESKRRLALGFSDINNPAETEELLNTT